MEDKEWLQLDEQDAVLAEIQASYKAPRFDPFEVFQPNKTFLKEVIKQLKNECYAKTRQIEEFQQNKWPIPSWLDLERTKLLRRIKEYEYRLRGGKSNSDIGESEIRRAKDYPLTDLYNEQTRRTGRLLVGRCPFHEEKSGSFTIYLLNNSWHCFGCNRGGDSIDYCMAHDDLSFIEAIKKLINN